MNDAGGEDFVEGVAGPEVIPDAGEIHLRGCRQADDGDNQHEQTKLLHFRLHASRVAATECSHGCQPVDVNCPKPASPRGAKDPPEILTPLEEPVVEVAQTLTPCRCAAVFRTLHCAMLFQFFTRCSAVRQASAWAVSVGFRAPLVPITEAPRMPRVGAS